MYVANAGTHNQVQSLALLSNSQRKPEADSSNDADVPCTSRRKTSVDAMLWHGVGKEAEEDKFVDMLWSLRGALGGVSPALACHSKRLQWYTLMQSKYSISGQLISRSGLDLVSW
jgi:hypothetical protein